jgi:hypothetical protein
MQRRIGRYVEYFGDQKELESSGVLFHGVAIFIHLRKDAR